MERSAPTRAEYLRQQAGRRKGANQVKKAGRGERSCRLGWRGRRKQEGDEEGGKADETARPKSSQKRTLVI